MYNNYNNRDRYYGNNQKGRDTKWNDKFGNNFTDNYGDTYRDSMLAKNAETCGAYQAAVSGAYGEFTVSSVFQSLPDEYAVMDNILLQQGSMLRPYTRQTIALYGESKFKIVNRGGKYYEVVPKSTQIDHVIVSPYGIFVIETKNHKGMIFGDVNGKVWTQVLNNGHFTFYNPVSQNIGHVSELSKQTGIPINCMVGMIVFSNPDAVLGNVNCNCCFTLDMLYNAILMYNVPLWDEKRYRKVIEAIDKLNTDSYLKAQEHKLYVQDIKHRHEINKAIAMNRRR